MGELLHIGLIPAIDRPAVESKVRSVAAQLGCNPDHIMQVIYAETGRTMKPSAQNTKFPFKKKNGEIDGYATGLIQFTPDTARFLGTTTEQLRNMSFVQQMDFVYKYFKPFTGKLKTYADVYLAVFFPVASGKSSDDAYVFETKSLRRSSVARSNPAIDINKDGTITMAEFKQYLIKTVSKNNFGRIFNEVVAKIENNSGKIVGATVFFWALGSLGTIVSL